MEQTLHFDIVTDVARGKTRSTFTERQRGDSYVRGAEPVKYVYVHDTGCMRMVHPDLWAAREITGRSKRSPQAAIPDDLAGAIRIATAHLVRYEGDGMNHTERQLDAIHRQMERRRLARQPRLVYSRDDSAQ